ncbi:MAG: ABC transporter ATP-binding protein [Bacillota bacterium]|nr:MAG: ABC transporter ATP-binding protein [Bacillota bacterium]
MPDRSAPPAGAAEQYKPVSVLAGAPPWLEMRGITKVYPDGTRALENVDLVVAKGEIHGLLGENGAGKSTLMKILSGILPLTSGRILLGGREVSLRSTHDALAHGIGMVHQHFSLVPTFNALDNIILGRGALLASPARAAARARIRRLMEETGLHVPLDIPVEQLPVGTQQRIEILKTLDRNVDLLILDEPTAALTPQETDQLFTVLRGLAARGTTIILITHKLREVLALTSAVTVLRHGRVVGSRLTEGATAQDMARMMVGTERMPDVKARREHQKSEPVLRVAGLTVKGDGGQDVVKNVSFEINAGEIFAIAGVTGNGQSELIEALAGLRPIARGRVYLLGQPINGKSPRELYRMGIAHVPEDRHRLGMVAQFSVLENSILGVHHEPRFRRGVPGTIHWGKVRRYARDIVRRFQVVTPSLSTPMRSLSGGNQQKLVVGRELSKSPSLVIAGQPTRGLDVAATAAIRDLLVDIRNEGKAVLLVSADLDEVLALADRIAVMYEGEIMAILQKDQFDRERIGLLMGGVRDGSAAG